MNNLTVLIYLHGLNVLFELVQFYSSWRSLKTNQRLHSIIPCLSTNTLSHIHSLFNITLIASTHSVFPLPLYSHSVKLQKQEMELEI